MTSIVLVSVIGHVVVANIYNYCLSLLLLSPFSRVRLCATP